jgi:disulfide bond formation protein DsbB
VTSATPTDMSTLTVTTFLALLALTMGAGAVLTVALAVVSSATERLEPLATLGMAIGPVALWLAFAVALTSTLGSLFLSEVAGFVPCALCWYQRIAMYPLVIVLGIAAWRGDQRVGYYAVPLATIGAIIAAYHIALQRLPGLPTAACSLDVPCTAIYVERFGFVTIPVMALIGFGSIVVILTLLVPRSSDS